MKLDYIGIYSNKRGMWPFSQTWFSMCSAHSYGRYEDCQACQAGCWCSDVKQSIGLFVYDNAPDFWRWWANR